ncbi:hydroxymethylbilane synthase [Actinoplanes sp. NPDC051411]|uniref:hydroxymethylbilane synthase n=1 Tax=Actinoplanes sp. NPDC051411 TaxID=3155522 RepID=UPI0034236E89
MSPPRTLRVGTRDSALARAQCEAFARQLTHATGQPVELVGIVTEGDLSTRPVTELGNTGVFVQAVRAALLAGTVDFAVHSAKDLPTLVPDGLVVAAFPAREDARDVLVARDGRKLRDLRPGARVGTGSPRRTGQLLALRPDLSVTGLRGNVDTRLRRVSGGDLDAVVLAYAGLLRLGRGEAATELLDPAEVLPAPAQGALAVECRTGDAETARLLSGLDDDATRAAVTAERAALARLRGGCSAPVGAYATVERGDGGGTLRLAVVVAAPDGKRLFRRTTEGSWADARALGTDLADRLIADGAGTVLRGA